MRTTFLPKTALGKASVGSFLAGIILGLASSVISNITNNQIEYPNPLNSPLLGSAIYLALTALILAVLIGMVATVRDKERAVSVQMIIPFGIVLLVVIAVFIIANLFGPH